MTECQGSDKVLVEDCGYAVFYCCRNETAQCEYASDCFTDVQLEYSFNGYVGDWRESYAAHLKATSRSF